MKNSTFFGIVIILSCIVVASIVSRSESKTATSANATVAQVYDTVGHSKSSFGNGLGYFSVNQSPGKVSVKPLSVIHKVITESCASEHWYVTSIVPCGIGVMIEGELCYSAALVTYTPIPVTISRDTKKSF